MDLTGTLVNGVMSIIGYVIVFFGVYKVTQIATDIREIKDLVASARRNPLTPNVVSGIAPGISKDLLGEDSAAAYAQSLLRAVNAESHGAPSETQEVR